MISFNEKDLALAMKRVGPAIKSGTLPILQHVLISCYEGKATLTASDLEVEISAELDADTDAPGEFTIDGARLKAISAAATKPVKIILSATDATVKSGRSTWKLQSWPGVDFPRLEAKDLGSLRIPGAAKAIRLAANSAANNDVRYYLNGIFIDAENNAIVGTDGHRITWRRADIDGAGQHIIPTKAALLIAGALDADGAEFFASKRFVAAESKGFWIIAKKIDGTYPNWQRVVKTDGTDTIKINKAELEAAIKRLLIVKDSPLFSVRASIHDEFLRLESVAQNSHQTAGEEIPILECKANNGEFCALETSYLLKALSNIDDDDIVIRADQARGNQNLLIGADSSESDGFDLIMGVAR